MTKCIAIDTSTKRFCLGAKSSSHYFALSIEQSKSLISNGTAKSGMIPKINSCINALESSVASFIINGTKYGNLTSIIKNSESVGTKFLVS